MTADARIPGILRCCGYRSRRARRWVGYCLELHVRVEGRDWDEVLERLILISSARLVRLRTERSSALPRKPRLRVWILYAYIALWHFLLRPRHDLVLTDLSPRLLLEGVS